jgi:hypothetical protein
VPTYSLYLTNFTFIAPLRRPENRWLLRDLSSIPLNDSIRDRGQCWRISNFQSTLYMYLYIPMLVVVGSTSGVLDSLVRNCQVQHGISLGESEVLLFYYVFKSHVWYLLVINGRGCRGLRALIGASPHLPYGRTHGAVWPPRIYLLLLLRSVYCFK